MDGEIIVKQGKSKGKRFPIKEGEKLSIGRGLKADIQLFDQGLSRVHCAVENRGGDFLVTDLESENGTQLNGKPIASLSDRQAGASAYAGDEIAIGTVVLEVAGPARSAVDLLSEAVGGRSGGPPRQSPSAASRAAAAPSPAPPKQPPLRRPGASVKPVLAGVQGVGPPGGSVQESDAAPPVAEIVDAEARAAVEDADEATEAWQEPTGSVTEFKRKLDPGKVTMLKAGVESTDESVRRAHRDLATIYGVTNAVNAQEDFRELADTLAQTVMDVLEADRAVVLLRDRRDGSTEPVAARDRDVEGPVSNPRVSRTVLSEVVSKGVSYFSTNVPEDDRFAAGGSLIIQRVKSVMCAPLLALGEVVGALYVDSRSSRDAFGKSDIELLVAIGNQAGVALQRARLLSDLDNLFFSTIRSLVRAVDVKDGYTHGHSERVTAFALKLAGELGLSRHEREIVQLAGLLHDIGKIGVPESVLNKAGDLTDEEFEQMKLHPVHGAEIVSSIESPHVPEIASAIRHHHERWDGSGYPEGLAGDRIPLIARILSIADAFDAMTSDRPYHKGVSMDRAVEIARDCSGTQFAPELAQGLVRLHERGELVLPQTMALKYTTMATPQV